MRFFFLSSILECSSLPAVVEIEFEELESAEVVDKLAADNDDEEQLDTVDNELSFLSVELEKE